MSAPRSLALNAERIGLLALNAPFHWLAIIGLFALTALFGISQLKTDDALTDLLRSNTHEYRDYEHLQKLFPTDELDVYVVAELPSLLTPEGLEKLRDIHFDLGLADGVSNVVSMFSVHEREPTDGASVPVIPEELSEGEEFQKLTELIRKDARFAGRLFADVPGQPASALMIVALDPAAAEASDVETVVEALNRELTSLGTNAGIKLGMTGAPVMKAELLAASRRDSAVFNVAGFLIGIIICFAFFRRWQYVVIVLTPNALAVLCTLGLMGLVGIRLNPMMNTIIPLVLVISFANGLHLVFSIRRQLALGQTVRSAIEHAVLKVGPACVLSAVTTAIAFASLALTDSRLIQVFGVIAAIATFITLILVTTAIPCLASVLLRQEHASSLSGNLTRFSEKLDALCEGLSVRLTRHYMMTCIVAGGLLVLSAVAYVQLDPRYRIQDIIPDGGQAAHYAAHIDRHFGGVKSLLLLIVADKDLTTVSDLAYRAAAEASAALVKQPQLQNVRSIHQVRESLPEQDADQPLAELLETLPENLSQRYVSSDRRAMLVAASVRDIEARPMNQIRKDMDQAARALTAAYPGFTFFVTGLATLSAERAIDTISSLNGGLVTAIAIVLILMGVLFRSLEVAVLSLIANLFAVVVTGLCLFVFDVGLQYVSVVGLTVAFGLAVDDTVHFLNRYWQERSSGASDETAVRTAVERVGPVLMLTTIVIVAGLAATLTSDVPPTRTFGAICMATLVFALIGDVIVLPGAILMYRKLRGSQVSNDPVDIN